MICWYCEKNQPSVGLKQSDKTVYLCKKCMSEHHGDVVSHFEYSRED